MGLVAGWQPRRAGSKSIRGWGSSGFVSWIVFGEPVTGKWACIFKAALFSFEVHWGFPAFYLNGTFIHGWLSNCCFGRVMRAEDLLFLHLAVVTPLIVVLDCISLIISKVEYFFLCLSVIVISFFAELSFKSFAHFLIRFVVVVELLVFSFYSRY